MLHIDVKLGEFEENFDVTLTSHILPKIKTNNFKSLKIEK